MAVLDLQVLPVDASAGDDDEMFASGVSWCNC